MSQLQKLQDKLPTDITQIKTLIEERIARRNELEKQKEPIQSEINQINDEIAELRTEIDVNLGLRERIIKRNPITGERLENPAQK